MDENNNNVHTAIDWLQQDSLRLKRPLERTHVEDVAQALKLSVSQQVELYEILAEKEIIEVDFSQLNAGEIDLEAAVSDDAGVCEPTIGTNDFLSKRFLTHEVLTAELERSLAQKIALGREADPYSNCMEEASIAREAENARQKFLTHNLRLTWRCAKFYAENSTLDMEDLFQEGVIGLMQAVEKFDYQLGFKFSTYAVWWIRQQINRYIVNNGAEIRIPAHLHHDIRRYRKARKILSVDTPGHEPSIRALVDELNWEREKVFFVSQLAHVQVLSIDAFGDDSNVAENYFFIDDGSFYQRLEQESTLALIKMIVRSLDSRACDIIFRRFNLNDTSGEETLESIAQDYNVTRERIRQIESKALGTLLIRLRNNGLDKDTLNDY